MRGRARAPASRWLVALAVLVWLVFGRAQQPSGADNGAEIAEASDEPGSRVERVLEDNSPREQSAEGNGLCSQPGQRTIWDAVQAHPELSLIEHSYRKSGTNVTAVLGSPDANITVFLPTDKAVTKFLLNNGKLRTNDTAKNVVSEIVDATPVSQQLAYVTYNMLYGSYPFNQPPQLPIPFATVLAQIMNVSTSTMWEDEERTLALTVKPGPTFRERLPVCVSSTFVQGIVGDFACLTNSTVLCNGVLNIMEGVELPAEDLMTFPTLPIDSLSVEVIEETASLGASDGKYAAVMGQPQSCSGEDGLPSIWDIIKTQNDTTLFATAVLYSTSGLDTVLHAAGINVTVFVPLNTWFAPVITQVDEEELLELGEDPSQVMDMTEDELFEVLVNTSFIQPAQILSGLMYYVVPGYINTTNVSVLEVPTLLDDFKEQPNNESYKLWVKNEGRGQGFLYGNGGTATEAVPASVIASFPACNGLVHVFGSATVLPTKDVASLPDTSLGDNIGVNDVRQSLDLHNVPYDPDNGTYFAQPNGTRPFPPPAPGVTVGTVTVQQEVTAIAVAVPVASTVTLICLSLCMGAVWYHKRRHRRGGSKGDKMRSQTQHWIDTLGESDDEAGPPLRSGPALGAKAGSTFGNLLDQLRAKENPEARKLREYWEISWDEIEILKGPDGERKKLGSGGFGEVYQGMWNGATPVAVKFVCPHVSKEEHVKTLYKEISVLKECRNNNIVQFYGACLVDNDVMLVTEYMPLGDLFHALQGPRGPQYRWRCRGKYIALDIIRGLVYLHSRKIVHCDMKSPNILLGSGGNAKIGDMGMSRVLAKASVTKSQSVGTWSWAAPELLLNSRINEQVDVYSFGIILWEVVTGAVPQRGCMRDFKVPEECSQALADLYERCIESDPAMRPSAKDVARELIRVIKLEREEEKLALENGIIACADSLGNPLSESFNAMLDGVSTTSPMPPYGGRHGDSSSGDEDGPSGGAVSMVGELPGGRLSLARGLPRPRLSGSADLNGVAESNDEAEDNAGRGVTGIGVAAGVAATAAAAAVGGGGAVGVAGAAGPPKRPPLVKRVSSINPFKAALAFMGDSKERLGVSRAALTSPNQCQPPEWGAEAADKGVGTVADVAQQQQQQGSGGDGAGAAAGAREDVELGVGDGVAGPGPAAAEAGPAAAGAAGEGGMVDRRAMLQGGRGPLGGSKRLLQAVRYSFKTNPFKREAEQQAPQQGAIGADADAPDPGPATGAASPSPSPAARTAAAGSPGAELEAGLSEGGQGGSAYRAALGGDDDSAENRKGSSSSSSVEDGLRDHCGGGAWAGCIGPTTNPASCGLAPGVPPRALASPSAAGCGPGALPPLLSTQTAASSGVGDLAAGCRAPAAAAAAGGTGSGLEDSAQLPSSMSLGGGGPTPLREKQQLHAPAVPTPQAARSPRTDGAHQGATAGMEGAASGAPDGPAGSQGVSCSGRGAGGSAAGPSPASSSCVGGSLGSVAGPRLPTGLQAVHEGLREGESVSTAPGSMTWTSGPSSTSVSGSTLHRSSGRAGPPHLGGPLGLPHPYSSAAPVGTGAASCSSSSREAAAPCGAAGGGAGALAAAGAAGAVVAAVPAAGASAPGDAAATTSERGGAHDTLPNGRDISTHAGRGSAPGPSSSDSAAAPGASSASPQPLRGQPAAAEASGGPVSGSAMLNNRVSASTSAQANGIGAHGMGPSVVAECGTSTRQPAAGPSPGPHVTPFASAQHSLWPQQAPASHMYLPPSSASAPTPSLAGFPTLSSASDCWHSGASSNGPSTAAAAAAVSHAPDGMLSSGYCSSSTHRGIQSGPHQGASHALPGSSGDICAGPQTAANGHHGGAATMADGSSRHGVGIGYRQGKRVGPKPWKKVRMQRSLSLPTITVPSSLQESSSPGASGDEDECSVEA